MDALNRTGICRLCADVKDSFLRIFDEEGYKLAIGIKINKYLQIQVRTMRYHVKNLLCS